MVTIAFNLGSPPVVAVGPGYTIGYNISGGPIPNDDFVELIVSDSANVGRWLATASHKTFGALSGSVTIGASDVEHLSIAQRTFPFAVGGAVTITLNLLHANFVTVDSVSQSGFTWDPTGALHWLITELLWRSVSSTALADVLAAVRKTFPVTH